MIKKVLVCTLFLVNLFGEPIVFISLPKSGTVYTYKTLTKATEREFVRISPNTFPKAAIDEDLITLLKDKEGITAEHCDTSSCNITLLEKYAPSLIVHVRDPRQAMISALHMIDGLIKCDRIRYSFLFPFPENYIDWSFEEKVDWLIDHYLVASVKWIQGWVDESEKNRLNIKFTTYEDFIDNQQEYFETILEFFDDEKSIENIVILPKTKKNHFRKGLKDEWREVMTVEQQIRATELMPQDFFTRFNWTP